MQCQRILGDDHRLVVPLTSQLVLGNATLIEVTMVSALNQGQGSRDVLVVPAQIRVQSAVSDAKRISFSPTFPTVFYDSRSLSEGTKDKMGDEKIRTRLNEVFRDVFDDEGLTVADTTTASDVEGWDSLAHVNLIVAVERAFGVSFTTKEIGGLGNVGDIVRLIETKTS